MTDPTLMTDLARLDFGWITTMHILYPPLNHWSCLVSFVQRMALDENR